MRPSGIPNPALPEGGSTGTTNTNGTSTTVKTNISLFIRNSCTGGSNRLPNLIIGVGTTGVAETLVKELVGVHPDPQKLTRAILNASSSYSNFTNVQVSEHKLFYSISINIK